MSAFTEAIDRFVRWFFNSSPTVMAIESPDADRAHVPALVRKGVVGGAVVIAIVLLMVFYSVVAGAVDQAAKRRVLTQVDVALSSTRSGHRPLAVANVVNVDPYRAAALVPRTVSYVRRAN